LYQAAADVLLMPYSSSFGGSGGGNIARVSSPLKMFEYLASGRAILASDIPVLREVLTDKTACFYQPENFKHLCQQFSALVSIAPCVVAMRLQRDRKRRTMIGREE